jgi:hypothetical protein
LRGNVAASLFLSDKPDFNRGRFRVKAVPLRPAAIFAVFSAPFFAIVPALAQQAIETCPSVPIVPQPKPADMTKRLNDDLDCLWRKVQNLEREVDRLKQEQAAKGQASPSLLPSSSTVQAPIPPQSNNAVVEGGVEITDSGAFLSDDKKTIYADINIKNTNNDNVLVMAVSVESSFHMHNTIIRSITIDYGIKDCTAHAGNAASTWLCMRDDDIRWSNLDRDKVYPVRLASMLDRPITATIADISLHILVKKDGKAKAYDATLNGIEIR